jgi:hypothetical protein
MDTTMTVNMFGDIDFRDRKVKCDLSGGINSMALLCCLANYPLKPKHLFIFYADFEEHSNDTLKFVEDGIEYAKKKFNSVTTKITHNSVLEYFREEKMIPHPMISPCSINLKLKPAREFYDDNNCNFDLIGYVKTEIRRMKSKRDNDDLFYNSLYPIVGLTDDECFAIVKKEIGWFPNIYDIKDEKGKRIFKHNNCLPCKNMTLKQLQSTSEYFPDKIKNALNLAKELDSYWGREAVPQELICDHCEII